MGRAQGRSPDTYSQAGEVIDYTYEVTSTGNATLHSVHVTAIKRVAPTRLMKPLLLSAAQK